MGGHHDPGVYRYPDGSGEPPSFDSCANCIDAACCPRCGMDWMTPIEAEDWDGESVYVGNIAIYQYAVDDQVPLHLWVDVLEADYPLPCPCCGWNWAKNDDDVIPPDIADMGPCECELAYDEKLSREYWDSMAEKARERGEL